MELDDFAYKLPEGRIALRPLSPKSSAKMLVFDGETVSDAHFSDLTKYLTTNDLLIFNDTKVIPSRLFGLRERFGDQGFTRAKIETTLLKSLDGSNWQAFVKPLKRINVGEKILYGEKLSATLIEKTGGGEVVLEFNVPPKDFMAAIAEVGLMPLPPYISSKRPVDDQDVKDYQPLFAKHEGAVASPTASLHFDQSLLDTLDAKGIEHAFVTLHVGAGTFLPVTVNKVHDHKMHTEFGHIDEDTVLKIAATKAKGGRVIAVGTTVFRLLETMARDCVSIQPWQGGTDIFIYPGQPIRLCDGLITNFHLPRSTLLMLVSAFIGANQTKQIYEHALASNYRFFSYGDGSLLLPK